ncbi:MAG: phosphate signaling complex protein PhoU [Pseudomonadales bacterium]|nr:phosphate signaling complex protein PhoU [Pseudomonadales bacterium]
MWKYVVTIVVAVLLLGFLIPEDRIIPVKGATPKDWNKDTFWYDPWGASGVHKGEELVKVGDTGNARGKQPHLHYSNQDCIRIPTFKLNLELSRQEQNKNKNDKYIKRNIMDSFNQDEHISHQFDQDLDALRSAILSMGEVVETQLQLSLDALLESGVEKANKVLTLEKQVNGSERNIDNQCVSVIAKRQPTAVDLRLVLAISKTNTDIERIGDEACKIAKYAIELSEDTSFTQEIEQEVTDLGQSVKAMLHTALEAYSNHDVRLAYEIVGSDKNIDLAYLAATQHCVTHMTDEPQTARPALNVLWSLRALERIGDHARNIAEQVIYLVKGIDVRHMDIRDFKEELLTVNG